MDVMDKIIFDGKHSRLDVVVGIAVIVQVLLSKFANVW